MNVNQVKHCGESLHIVQEVKPIGKRQKLLHGISGSWHLILLSSMRLKNVFVVIACVRSAGGCGCHGGSGHVRRERPVGQMSGYSIETGTVHTISLTLLDRLSVWINGANLSFNNSSVKPFVFSYFHLLKCEYFLVSFLLYDRKLDLLGLWTKQDIWDRHLVFTFLLQETRNRFVKEVIDRLSDNLNNH